MRDNKLSLILFILIFFSFKTVFAKPLVGRLLKNFQSNYESGSNLAILTTQNIITRIDQSTLNQEVYRFLHSAKDRVIEINGDLSHEEYHLESAKIYAQQNSISGMLSLENNQYQLVTKSGRVLKVFFFIDHRPNLKDLNLDQEIEITGAFRLINDEYYIMTRNIKQSKNESSAETYIPNLRKEKTLTGKIIFNQPNDNNPKEGLAILTSDGNFEIRSEDNFLIRAMSKKIGEFVQIKGEYERSWSSDNRDYEDYDDEYYYDEYDEYEDFDDQVTESYTIVNSLLFSNIAKEASGVMTREYNSGYQYFVTKKNEEDEVISKTKVKLIGEMENNFNEEFKNKNVTVYGKVFQNNGETILYVESYQLNSNQ